MILSWESKSSLANRCGGVENDVIKGVTTVKIYVILSTNINVVQKEQSKRLT
jgi:hypothetical protein